MPAAGQMEVEVVRVAVAVEVVAFVGVGIWQMEVEEWTVAAWIVVEVVEGPKVSTGVVAFLRHPGTVGRVPVGLLLDQEEVAEAWLVAIDVAVVEVWVGAEAGVENRKQPLGDELPCQHQLNLPPEIVDILGRGRRLR